MEEYRCYAGATPHRCCTHVHTSAKDKLRPLLLTPPFAEGSNPGPFATLSTTQPLSHMWLKFHGAISQYKNIKNVLYINNCQDKEQIISVTLLLVILFNAWFTYQTTKASNLFIDALDTFDLKTTLEDDTFMNTFSGYIFWYKFVNFGIDCIAICFHHLHVHIAF